MLKVVMKVQITCLLKPLIHIMNIVLFYSLLVSIKVTAWGWLYIPGCHLQEILIPIMIVSICMPSSLLTNEYHIVNIPLENIFQGQALS